MHYSNCLSILIVSSIVILGKWSNARVIFDNEYRDNLEEQDKTLLKQFNKRHVKRETICPTPYHVLTADNRCVWSCGQGTQPDTTTNECVCQDGYYETGTDQFGRRVCTICPKPYHVVTSDNRCVWSCGQGTQPDITTNECVCQDGYYETGTDQFGRRVCTICPKPYHVVTSDSRCVWSCGQGTQPDITTNECVCQDGYYETGTDQFGRRICSPK
ncbi:unnamed protein product [Rotaria sp. Silwood1]|nr:unnamed protein product [Rotaria sp. Silwood1]